MKINKLDNNVKEKFGQREIAPSVSAWERLSAQLDGQPKHKKRSWFLYAGYAASILILISICMYTFSSDSIERMPLEDVLVKQEIDTVQILHKIDEVFNEIPIEKALVKSEIIKEKQIDTFTSEKVSINLQIAGIEKDEILKKEVDMRVITIESKENRSVVKVEENKAVIIPITETITNKKRILQSINTRIKVNAEDLLFAVTNESKYPLTKSVERNMNSADLLITIKNELKKSNFKVDPKIILSEVEGTIEKDFFQNSFLKIIKTNLTNLARNVVNRNN